MLVIYFLNPFILYKVHCKVAIVLAVLKTSDSSILKSYFTSMVGSAAVSSAKVQLSHTKTQDISALNSTDLSQLLPTMSNALYSVTKTSDYKSIYSTDFLIHSLQSSKILPTISSYSSSILGSTLPQATKSTGNLYSNTVTASPNGSTHGSPTHDSTFEDVMCIVFLLFISGIATILLVGLIVQIIVSNFYLYIHDTEHTREHC